MGHNHNTITKGVIAIGMSIISRTAHSVHEGTILGAILDRAIAIPHTKLVSILSEGYIMKQDGISADLSRTDLRPLVKYRLKKGRLKHEEIEISFINKYLNSKYDVVDLGAGMGFTSCAAGNLLDDDSTVVAVEANTNLEAAIEHNAALNDVTILPTMAAYAPGYESVLFGTEGDYRSASIYQDSSEITEINTTNLIDLTAEHGIREFQLISDIEGSEAELVHEMDLLSDYCRTMIIELHKEKNPKVDDLINELRSSGFNQIDSKGRVAVYQNTNI